MASSDRHAKITTYDHGPMVNVASWILLCMSILFTAFRLISNIILRGTAGRDDCIVALAVAFAIAQSIATSMMVANGLGQRQGTLDSPSIASYQKALLASSMLYVAALAFCRFSMLHFLSRLISAPQKVFRLLLSATWACVLVYLVAELLTLSFACTLPSTWDTIHGQCLNLGAFWAFDTAFDIATSVIIVALPVIIVWPLQMSAGRKFQAIMAFVFQVPPCVFAIVRLLHLQRALHSTDQTWESVDWQIWTQINLHFSIVAADMPCLKVFLEGFQSVLFRPTMGSSVGDQTELRSYPRSKRIKSRGEHGRWSASLTKKGVFRPEDGESSTAIKAAASPQPESECPLRINDGDGKIYKTTEWTVFETGEDAKRRQDDTF